MPHEELKRICLNCKECELHKTRNNVVYGTGNENASVVFIGEAPGKNEDELAMPFVGRSGALLDKYLAEIGLYRDKNIYISNIVKCRPPSNRTPLQSERNACVGHLYNQLKIIRPKIAVCLGSVAAKTLIRRNFSIMKEHGLYEDIDGILYTATLHPAAILRNVHNAPIATQDFAALRVKIAALCGEDYFN